MKKSLEYVHRGFHTDARPGALTPEACPMCGESPAPMTVPERWKTMEAHLLEHAPASPCQKCEGQHRRWRLDWDSVVHARVDLLFFCDPCGFYAHT
jgi:hypothetical protein